MDGAGTTDVGSSASEQPERLKRGIGQWLLLFFVVGDIIGAGIYALVGQVGPRSAAPSGLRSCSP
jgi:basic amino acid/polyamine antiporter, APA family